MTLTDEQRETVERVLKSKTTEAYRDKGYECWPNTDEKWTHYPYRQCGERASDADRAGMQAFPLLKFVILEQRERIAELEEQVKELTDHLEGAYR
jgi:hypothetical protein